MDIRNEGTLSVDDGVSKVVDADASLVAKEYYTDYAKYVLEYRALPGVCDGLKPVQRRIIYIANQQPKKLMKTAKLSGLCLALHPHGSSSITGAINNMAYPLNNLPLFTTKGNFGSVNAGPSADRYTECYLSEVARMNFCQFIDYADYEVGEIGEMEPSSLPCLIPYSLIEGSEGIAVGLSTKVMPLNLLDLIDYYIDYIKRDGSPKKSVRPDVGYVLLENEESVKDIVNPYKGRITTSSVVSQISDTTFLIEGLYGKSIDSVINKIDKYDKYFTKDQVGFRDASSTSMKYVFEIYDKECPTAEKFKESLVWATRCNTTFNRVVEENGSAVYATLDYVVKRSLECLNRAIDKKIQISLEKSRDQLSLYEVLRRCKELGIFRDVTKMTSEELVSLIVRSTDCEETVAREVVKRPISYLTRSHDSEEESLRSQIKDLESHDRKKYLVQLYKDFRKAVLPIYESKKHTISRNDMISDPCVFVDSNGNVSVRDGEGKGFDSVVYFISEKGYIYKRSLSTFSASDIVVETFEGEKIVGVCTDRDKYLFVTTCFNYEGWEGQISVDLSSISYDKRFISLRDDEGEKIKFVEGYSRLTDKVSSVLKTKVSKSVYRKV